MTGYELRGQGGFEDCHHRAWAWSPLLSRHPHHSLLLYDSHRQEPAAFHWRPWAKASFRESSPPLASLMPAAPGKGEDCLESPLAFPGTMPTCRGYL